MPTARRRTNSRYSASDVDLDHMEDHEHPRHHRSTHPISRTSPGPAIQRFRHRWGSATRITRTEGAPARPARRPTCDPQRSGSAPPGAARRMPGMKSDSVWRRVASRPPTVCWIRTACTTMSMSRTSRRSAIRSSESRGGGPGGSRPRPGELLRHGRPRLFAHHLDGPQEGVAGGQGRRDQAEGVGELASNACGACGSGGGPAGRRRDSRDGTGGGDDIEPVTASSRAARPIREPRHDDVLAGPERDPGPFQRRAEGLAVVHPVDDELGDVRGPVGQAFEPPAALSPPASVACGVRLRISSDVLAPRPPVGEQAGRHQGGAGDEHDEGDEQRAPYAGRRRRRPRRGRRDAVWATAPARARPVRPALRVLLTSERGEKASTGIPMLSDRFASLP